MSLTTVSIVTLVFQPVFFSPKWPESIFKSLREALCSKRSLNTTGHQQEITKAHALVLHSHQVIRGEVSIRFWANLFGSFLCWPFQSLPQPFCSQYNVQNMFLMAATDHPDRPEENTGSGSNAALIFNLTTFDPSAVWADRNNMLDSSRVQLPKICWAEGKSLPSVHSWHNQSDNGLAKGCNKMMSGSSATAVTSIKLSFMLY